MEKTIVQRESYENKYYFKKAIADKKWKGLEVGLTVNLEIKIDGRSNANKSSGIVISKNDKVVVIKKSTGNIDSFTYSDVITGHFSYSVIKIEPKQKGEGVESCKKE